MFAKINGWMRPCVRACALTSAHNTCQLNEVRCRCVMCRTHIHLIFALFIFSNSCLPAWLLLYFSLIPLHHIICPFSGSRCVRGCVCVFAAHKKVTFNALNRKRKPKQYVCVHTNTIHWTQGQVNIQTQTNATTFDKFSQVVRHRSDITALAMHDSLIWSSEQRRKKTLAPIYCFYLLTINRLWTNIYQMDLWLRVFGQWKWMVDYSLLYTKHTKF